MLTEDCCPRPRGTSRRECALPRRGGGGERELSPAEGEALVRTEYGRAACGVGPLGHLLRGHQESAARVGRAHSAWRILRSGLGVNLGAMAPRSCALR